jgi:hypothetical protein
MQIRSNNIGINTHISDEAREFKINGAAALAQVLVRKFKRLNNWSTRFYQQL